MPLIPRFRDRHPAKVANSAKVEAETVGAGPNFRNFRTFRNLAVRAGVPEEALNTSQITQGSGCELSQQSQAPALESEAAVALAPAVFADSTTMPSTGPVGEVSDRIQAYHERLAICLEGGDISSDEAVRIASEEAATPIAVLAELQVAAWRTHIEALPVPTDPALSGLKAELIEQLALPWLTYAARLGWTGLELFGAHPLAPAVRSECWGVAVSVALSPFNRTDRAGRRRICSIEAVTENRLAVVTPTGARFGAQRFARGLDGAMCVWDLPAFAPTMKHLGHTCASA